MESSECCAATSTSGSWFVWESLRTVAPPSCRCHRKRGKSGRKAPREVGLTTIMNQQCYFSTFSDTTHPSHPTKWLGASFSGSGSAQFPPPDRPFRCRPGKRNNLNAFSVLLSPTQARRRLHSDSGALNWCSFSYSAPPGQEHEHGTSSLIGARDRRLRLSSAFLVIADSVTVELQHRCCCGNVKISRYRNIGHLKHHPQFRDRSRDKKHS
ncbi:hypothetical protein IWX49DRAFT_571549 [Phyllosticta citricarpa]|uniref:Uncharacterized protein n=1 Tax=Phyllosticta citricarpa TaxID=55181 RepID=A0ABR1MRD1_9PEZI